MFVYISKEVLSYTEDDMILIPAYGTIFITNTNQMASSFISPCNHQEADTRVFLHVNDRSLKDHSKIIIRKVDTDVLVLTVSVFARLNNHLEELWVDFGAGKHRNDAPVHLIFNNLGESRIRGLKCSFIETCSSINIHCWICMGTINSCKPIITWLRGMGIEEGQWTDLPDATVASWQLIKCS